MSLYDIAVQKLGFPTIELFVKVSRKIKLQVVLGYCLDKS